MQKVSNDYDKKNDKCCIDQYANRCNGDFNFWMQQQQYPTVHKEYLCIYNTQAASSENTTASDIATTADDSAESVTSIKKDGYLAIPIADLSQTASFYKADLDGTEVEIVASDRTVTDDEIQISYDVLKATADELPKFFQ